MRYRSCLSIDRLDNDYAASAAACHSVFLFFFLSFFFIFFLVSQLSVRPTLWALNSVPCSLLSSLSVLSLSSPPSLPLSTSRAPKASKPCTSPHVICRSIKNKGECHRIEPVSRLSIFYFGIFALFLSCFVLQSALLPNLAALPPPSFHRVATARLTPVAPAVWVVWSSPILVTF